MVLSVQERKRKEAAKLIVKTLSNESSVVEKTLSKVDIKNIPNSVEPAIRNWIRQHKGKHEVYGSAAMATHSFGTRQPNDLDVVVENPRGVSQALSRLLRSKKITTKTVSKPKWNSYAIQIKDKKGDYQTAIDIHPIKGHAKKYELHGKTIGSSQKQGVTLQSATDQLLRKGNAITLTHKGVMGAGPHRNVKDTEDFIATAKLLLSSMELKTEAKKAKATKLRAAIRTWESHLKQLKNGGAVSKKVVFTKPQKKRYVKKVVEQPEYPVDEFVFETEQRVVRKKKVVKKPKPKQKRKKRRRTTSPMAIDEMMGKELGAMWKW